MYGTRLYNIDPRAPHSPTPPTGRTSMIQGDDAGQRAEKITKTPYFWLTAVSNERLNFSRQFEKRPIVAGSFQSSPFLPSEPQAHKPPALGVSLFRDRAAQPDFAHLMCQARYKDSLRGLRYALRSLQRCASRLF